MAIRIQLFDGSLLEFPDNTPQDVIDRVAKQETLARQPAPQPRPVIEPPKKEGLGAAFGKGLESLLGSSRTAIGAFTGSPEEAALAALERQKQSPYADQVSLEKVSEAAKRGLLPAAGEVARQVPLAIAEQAPNVLATLGSARLGAMAGAGLGSIVPGVGTAIGGIGGGIIGAIAPSLLQQFGGNIQRQAQEQQERGQPIAIDRTAAGAAALPQAGLDVAASLIPLGRTFAGKVLGPQVEQLLKRGSVESAERLARESLPTVLGKGAAISIATEVPTEVIQTMLERSQAGLALTTPDALAEYGNVAYQAGLLAPIGAVGRVGERFVARDQALLPGQRRGESDMGFANRLSQEISNDRAYAAALQAQPEAPPAGPPSVMELADIASKPQGYENLEAIKQQILQAGTQKENQETLAAIKDFQNGIVVGEIQRRQPSISPVMDDKTLRSLGFVPGGEKSVYNQLINQDTGSDEVRVFLTDYAQKKAKPQTKQRIEKFLAQVERSQIPLAQGATDAGAAITEPSGAGVQVAVQPGAGAPAEGLRAPEPAGVVPPVADVGPPAGGAEAAPPAITPVEPVKPVETPKTETEAKEQHAVQGLPIIEAPLDQLTLSKDVPQFKSDADEKGVVEKLGGKFDRTGVAPIQVWRRTDGRMEVISGRHRLDLAQRSGEATIPAQIHDEAQGFDAKRAAMLDAELNIRDQQGKVKDYVNYFENAGISQADADARGLLARPPGRQGFAIATQGSPDLIASHRANVVNDAEAFGIASAAPGDARLQALGIKAISDGKNVNGAVNMMKAVKALAAERGVTEDAGDLFGFDDSAMREAEEMAKIASRKQSEVANRLSAISGASKRPEVAKKEGIDIKDPEALKRREKELRQQKASWDNWSSSSELIQEIKAEMVKPSLADIPATRWGEIERRAKAAQAAPAKAEAAPEKAELTPEQEALNKEIEAKIDQLEKVLKKIMNKFGLKDVALKLIDNMRNEGEYAQSVVRLALDAVNPVQALRHESIHALKELGFFSPQQWAVLEKQAKNKWIDQYLKTKNINKEDLEEGQKSRYDAYMELYKGDMDAIIEEAIADAFGDFDVNKAPPGLMQAILTRLRNFFDAVKTAFGGEVTAEQVFRKVEKGALKAEAKAEAAPAKPSIRVQDKRGSWYSDATPQQQETLDRWEDERVTGKVSNWQNLDIRPAREDIYDSASAFFYDYEKANGLFDVPITDIGPLSGYDNAKDKARIQNLAEQIKESGEIEPVFVAVDPNGEAYLMEGQHRSRALELLGYKSVPARVIVSMDQEEQAAAKPSLRAPQTEAFKRWFGDSKVVDADGNPLVVYHGTNQEDDNTTDGAIGQFLDWRPIWFTVDPYQASGYATQDGRSQNNAAIYPAYLAIRKPFRVRGDMNDKITWADARTEMGLDVRPGPYGDEVIDGVEQEVPKWWVVHSASFAEAAEAAGFDGVYAVEGGTPTYAAFKPTQIKSATGNIGTFDAASPDIRYSLRDAAKIDLDRSLNDKRISPRLPTAVKAKEDAMGEVRLQPDLDTFKRDDVAFRHNIALMSKYPNFSHLKGTPAQRAEQMIEHMKGNLLWLFNSWDANLRDRSKLWYVGGNRIAHRWADKYGIPAEQAAGIIAALSPQKDWFQNVSLAERTLDALVFNADTTWSPEMTRVFKDRAWAKKFPLSKYQGTTLKDMYRPGDAKSLVDMAVWIRAWDEANNPQMARVITPEGTFTNEMAAGKTGKPVAMRAQSFAAMVKTLQVLQHSDLQIISDLIGKNHKVRSFYNNIIAPYSGDDVTIDTHAVAAALLRPLGSSDLEVYHNFGSAKPAKKDKEGNILIPASSGTKNSAVTGLYGTYSMYAEAYRRAAEDAGVLPRELQSITWEAIRGLFRPEQKQAKLKNQTNVLWNKVGKGEIDGQSAREEISKLVSGIEDPAWAKSPVGANDSRTDSSYSDELPGVSVSGREPAGVPRGTGERVAGAVPKLSLRSASWSDKRVETLLDKYSYLQNGREKDTKAYAAFVRPEDFLAATTPVIDRERLESEKTPLDVERLAEEDQEIFLDIKTTEDEGVYQITGHEGRHRMMALRDSGVTSVPVVFYTGGTKNAEIVEEPYFKSQEHRGDKRLIKSQRGFSAMEMIPINWDQRNNIKETFGGEGKVKFSLRVNIPPSARARVVATIASRQEKGFVERLMEAISPTSYSDFRAQALNRYNQLGVYDKIRAKKMGGAALLADSSAESAALLSDLGAGLTASALGVHDRMGGIPVFRNGITIISNQNGTIKGPTAIFAPLASDPAHYRDYQFWAGVKRGSRYMQNPQGKYEEKLFTPSDVKEAEVIRKAYLKAGIDFEAMQKEWIKYNDGLVQYMVDAGVLSKERADLYRKHADYLPFYRQMDGRETIGPKVFQAISGVKPPKAAKGGEALLDDFLENIVRNTQSAIQAGVKNVAAQRAAKVAMDIGMASPLGFKSSAAGTFDVLENGQVVTYQSKDELFINAIKSLGIPDLPFIGLLSGPANLLRNLVTKDPGFMLANLMRDSMSAWVTSGVKMTPVVNTITNFGAAIAGKDPAFQALMNAGILGGYEFSQNVEQSGREFGKALKKQAKIKSTGLKGVAEMGAKPFTSLWDALEKGTTASDAATRMEVYKRTLAETNNEAEALFRALEVMNFNRKGSSAVVRILTAAVPFLNARMQGLDVLYRAASGQMNARDAAEVQKQFFVRGAMMASLSAAYWLLTHDDEEYKKQEQETRDNYWLLPSMGVKIPIPFEIGVLFKVIPERILGYAFGSDTGEDFLKSMARQLGSTLAFNPIPQAFMPIVETTTNFSFFTMRPIVGQGLEGLQPAYQVGPGTSRLAESLGAMTKGMAKELQVSPAKIDQLISGYTGTMGMYLVNLMDAVYDMNTASPKPSKRFEQMPLIRRFALDPEARGNVTAYYELKNSVDSIVRTSNMLERTMNYEELPGYLMDNMKMLASKDYILDLEKTMKEFREMKILIRSSKMDADAKRDAILSIDQMENQLTSNIQYMKKLAKGD
jgi:hypothetical protein